MINLGDFFTSDVPYRSFVSLNANGLPTSLGGSPAFKVMKDDGTSQSSAGVTFVADLGGVVGTNSVKVDTSADGTFYAAGHDFFIVATSGTADGQSIIGYIIALFSIQNRTALRPTTKGRTLGVNAGGQAGIDIGNVGNPTTTLDLSGTTIKNVDNAVPGVSGNVSGSVGSVTGNVGGNVVGSVASVTGNVGGNVVGSVASVTGNVGGNVTGSVGSVLGNVAGSVGSVLGNVAGTVASVVGNVGGNVVGSVGSVLAAVGITAGSVQAIWDALTSALTTVNSIGRLLVTNIDAAISSRAPASTALSTAQWTNGRASNLDNLDATVSSRLPTSSYVAPDNADIAAIKVKTDQLTFTSSNVNANAQVVSDKTGYALTVAQHTQIASDVWDSLLSAHTMASTFGANAQTPAINPTQVAQAVWNALTASYTVSGSFGNNLQNAVLAASGIAASVWNALLVNYNASGSFGANAQNPSITPTQVSQAVWNALLVNYATAGTFGGNAQSAAITPTQVTAAVWDVPQSDHTISGTTGATLATVGGQISALGAPVGILNEDQELVAELTPAANLIATLIEDEVLI